MTFILYGWMSYSSSDSKYEERGQEDKQSMDEE